MENPLQERALRVEDAYRLLQNNKDGLGNIPGILRQLVLLKVWEGYEWQGRVIEFETFREFVEASPPEGLGTTIEDLISFCKKYPEIADLIDETVQLQSPSYRPPKGRYAGETRKRPSGTSYARSIRQLRTLAENNPAAATLRDEVLKGLLSPSRALATIKNTPKKIHTVATPEGVINMIKRHLDIDQIKVIVNALSDQENKI